jgi:hypothetical protein
MSRRHQDSQTFAAVKGPKGLTILARPFFDRFVSALPDGAEGSLTWEPRKDKRSNRANRMMWGVAYEQAVEVILSAEGYRRDQWAEMKALMHEGLCARYQGYVTCPVTKQQVRKFRTSKASKAEFTAYIEWLAQMIAEDYGVAIELPGDAA